MKIDVFTIFFPALTASDVNIVMFIVYQYFQDSNNVEIINNSSSWECEELSHSNASLICTIYSHMIGYRERQKYTKKSVFTA